MRRTSLLHLVAAALVLGGAHAASAQAPPAPAYRTPYKAAPLEQQYNCPPGVDPRKAPLLGEETTGFGGTLSEQLAESRGIVCPPTGIDAGIVAPPPADGTLRVIPPPGGGAVPK